MANHNAILNWRANTGLVLLILLFIADKPGFSAVQFDAPPPSLSPRFSESARKNLEKRQADYTARPRSTTNAWQLARAYFELGEFATNNQQRAELAEAGINVARLLIERDPALAEGWYYYGLNSGQLARTKMLGALPLVRKMEDSFFEAAKRQPKLDHAGAHRCLALLYRDAPGWPISIGSRRKAREQLEKLTELAPDYPENRIVRMETWLKWSDAKALKAELKSFDEIWEQAPKRFAGEEWRALLDDWQGRWEEIQRRAKELLGE